MRISKILRWATSVAILYVTAHTITFTVLLFVGCREMQGRWMQLDLKWRASYAITCGSSTAIVPATGALSVLGDVIAIAIPAAVLCTMRLPKRQMWALYSIVALAVG